MGCLRKLKADFYFDLRTNTNSTIRTTSRKAFNTRSIGSICWNLLWAGGALATTWGGGGGAGGLGTATAGTGGGAKAGAGGGAKAGAGGKGTAAGKTGEPAAGAATFSAGDAWPAAEFANPPEMMRVNSPGPANAAGSDPAAGGGGWEEAADACSSFSLWINMVMLSGAPAEGPAGCGLCPLNSESDGSPKRWAGGSFSTERDRNNRVAPADSRPSVLGAESRLDGHADSTGLGGALATGKGRGGGGGEAAGVWKSWVKLPSADAESDTPGVENPFMRGVAAGANGTGSGMPDGRCFSEAVAATNMRVNSPGSWRRASGGTPGGGAELVCGGC
jgi:hypothetical protein